VGGKAQLPAYRRVAGLLRLAYAQFEELETFARFATRLDEHTRARIERGRRVREALRQHAHAPMTPAAQVAVLHAAAQGLFDALDTADVTRGERQLLAALREQGPALAQRIESGAPMSDDDWAALEALARGAIGGG
jgi:F-type H+-transporting ATPase subunit alpha